MSEFDNQQPQGQQPQGQQQGGRHLQRDSRVPYAPVTGPNWWFVAHHRFSVVGGALAVMLVIWNVLARVLAEVVAVFAPNANPPMWLIVIISNGPLYCIAMPVAWLILRRLPVMPTRSFSLGGARFWRLLLESVPIMYAGSLIGSLLAGLVSQGKAVNGIDEIVTNSDPITSVVLLVIVAPLFEEWMFRKQIIDHIRQYGEKTAILLSALAFSLFHANLFQTFYTFGLGLVLGYVYVRTSRLRYSLLMHMIINFNGGIVAPWVASQVDTSTMDAIDSGSSEQLESAMAQGAGGVSILLVYGLCMLALAIAGIVLLIRNRKRAEFYITPEELPRGLHARTSLLNPGFVVYAVLCLVVTVLSLFMS